jgi:alpha-tubulin suppressor-like RCC1 family protein
VREIATGPRHLLLVDANGDAWSAGDSACGRLGHSPVSRWVTAPRRIEGISNASAVAAGGEHSLVRTTSGTVYSFGSGANGRHGHGEGKRHHMWLPGELTTLSRRYGVTIVDMAAGGSHSLVVSEMGALFSWGYGASGQLGLGVVPTATYSRHSPSPIKLPEGVRIASASAGEAHSLAVSVDGRLYSFGFGGSGRLGHGADTTDRPIPKLVDALVGVDVRMAAAGAAHSVALTDDGRIFTFGSPKAGVLGLGGRFERAGAAQMGKYVGSFERRFARHAASAPAAFISAAHGDRAVASLYAFGNAASDEHRFGEPEGAITIGHGEGPLRLGLAVQQVVALGDKPAVVEVAAGGGHTIVRLEDGSLWAWGSNESGQLGLPWKEADQGNRSLPARVEGPTARRRPVIPTPTTPITPPDENK